MQKKKNLIFVSLDTVRADVAYSGKFEAIEKLRNVGVTFLNTISSSPLTPVSHATVFTGLQPFNHGVRHLFKEQINKDVPVLAEILKSEGYKTGAIVSCPGMNRWYGFSRGFDHYDDEIPLLADGSDPLQTVDVKKRGTALKRAEVVIDRAIQWISKNKDGQPFFVFLHFFDAHWPYEAPKKFAGDNIYEEEVAYSAHHFGLFIKKMEEMNLLLNTTVVCFSDHGEDLDGMYPNDKGGEKLGHPEELGHGCLLYDQTQKVVLIIKDPSLKEGINIEEQVRLVDIMPTTLELLDIQKSVFSFDGVSILPVINGEKLNLPAYSETFYPEEQTAATGGKFSETRNKKSIRIKNSEKIITHLSSDYIEVYDLKQDPNEMKNLLKNE
ncbi:sulfatase [Candidatus Parcubacteria bacterium]|nr:sulfatase [Candidatus Parcubacteria bacterium]